MPGASMPLSFTRSPFGEKIQLATWRDHKTHETSYQRAPLRCFGAQKFATKKSLSRVSKRERRRRQSFKGRPAVGVGAGRPLVGQSHGRDALETGVGGGRLREYGENGSLASVSLTFGLPLKFLPVKLLAEEGKTQRPTQTRKTDGFWLLLLLTTADADCRRAGKQIMAAR